MASCPPMNLGFESISQKRRKSKAADAKKWLQMCGGAMDGAGYGIEALLEPPGAGAAVGASLSAVDPSAWHQVMAAIPLIHMYWCVKGAVLASGSFRRKLSFSCTSRSVQARSNIVGRMVGQDTREFCL